MHAQLSQFMMRQEPQRSTLERESTLLNLVMMKTKVKGLNYKCMMVIRKNANTNGERSSSSRTETKHFDTYYMYRRNNLMYPSCQSSASSFCHFKMTSSNFPLHLHFHLDLDQMPLAKPLDLRDRESFATMDDQNYENELIKTAGKIHYLDL